MIAASAVLVVVAFVTLIIGIFQTGLGLIWVSIASSVLAAIFLLLGVVKGRPPRVATAGAEYGEPAWGDAAGAPTFTEAPTAAAEAPPAIILGDEEDEEFEEEAPVEEMLPPRRSTAAPPSRSTTRSTTSRTTTSRATASRAPAKKAAAKKTAARTPAAQQPVVVIPDRDKFHKAACRYAKGPGTMKLTKSEARREGYKACGVCKP
ncbi:MAG TPA: hypothetical protein VGB64_06985 [Actinomycetota bacterium]